jgi:hypothetical protein
MTGFVSERTFEQPESVPRGRYRARFGTEYGAAVEGALDEGIGALGRAAERGAYAGSSTFDRALSLGLTEAGGGPMIGARDAPQPIETPLLSADDVNTRYAPIGADGKPVKLTDTPMREGLARLLGEQKRREIERDKILDTFHAQAPWYTQLGTFLTAPLADPLNVAAGFLPGIGEEAILARVGGGFLARTVARVGAGATAGVAAQAPLSALRYGLSQEEGGDYTLRSAFRDLMFGAAIGAVFHTGIGTAGELVFGAPRGRITAPEERPVPSAPEERPVPAVPEEAPRAPFGGGEEMENPFLRPQPEDEEPVPPPHPSVPLVGRDLRLAADDAALRAEDANLLRQLRDLPRGGRAAANTLARLDVVERALADESLSPEARTNLQRRRDELLTDTTPEKLKEQAAPLEGRRTLQAQRAAIAAKLDAIAAERGQPKIISRFGDIAETMQRILSADAETKAAAARAAVSQIIDGRPVDVLHLFDFRETKARETEGFASEQQGLYEDGYSPGFPQEEFDTLHGAMYGDEAPPVELADSPRAPGEELKAAAPKAEGEAKPSLKTQMADLLRRFIGKEADIADLKTLDKDGAIAAALKDVVDAGLMEDAYSQAAQCLTEGEM